MRDLLNILDALGRATGAERITLQDRLAIYHTAAPSRVRALREQLASAGQLVEQVQEYLSAPRVGGLR